MDDNLKQVWCTRCGNAFFVEFAADAPLTCGCDASEDNEQEGE